MRKAWLTGEGQITDPLGGQTRFATFTCYHCNRVVNIPPKADPDKLGGWCSVCDKAICPQCVKLGVCDVLEEKLKRWESRDAAIRSYGIREELAWIPGASGDHRR